MQQQLLQIEVFLIWMESFGTFEFDLAGKNYLTGTFLCPTRSKATNLKRSEILSRYLGWLRAMNAQGFNIFIRPARTLPHQLIFLDDIPKPRAVRAANLFNCIVVETSPSNCQIWLAVSQFLDEHMRSEVQRALIRKLHLDCPSCGDDGSTGGEHFGRFPGFRNKKPDRDNWTVVVASSTNKKAYPLLSLSPEGGGCALVPSRTPPLKISEPIGVQAQPPFIGERKAASASEHEFGIAIKLYLQGSSRSAVEKHIFELACARGKHGGNITGLKYYARRTAERAAAALFCRKPSDRG